MTSMEEPKVVGAVPPPPAYFKLFASKGQKGSANDCEGQSLNYEFPLAPPPLPAPGDTYRLFGIEYSTDAASVELLPPEKMVIPSEGQPLDYREEMKAVLDSIMVNYGQFMKMLVSSPAKAHEKLTDVETLFVNMHSLLNRYRAHQARHLLLGSLQDQVDQQTRAISSLEAAVRECIERHHAAAETLGLDRARLTLPFAGFVADDSRSQENAAKSLGTTQCNNDDNVSCGARFEAADEADPGGVVGMDVDSEMNSSSAGSTDYLR